MFTYFNHDQLRRYIVAFGSFFNKLEVRRKVGTDEVQRFKVPLDYGPKERWLTRLVQDPDLAVGTGITVPRMAYEMPKLNYDSTRKLNTLNSLKFASIEQNRLARMYVGVPYKLDFELSLLVKNQQDGLQIAEQILPYFTPDLVFAMKTLPDLGLVDQIPLTLHTVTSIDNYEGDFEKRRAIVWTFGFHMQVYFYGPVRDTKRITEVTVDIYNTPWDADLSGEPVEIITENQNMFLNEDASGHLLSEETANTYLSVGRVARIQAVADPNQEPIPASQGGNVVSTTTITEYDGDIKRNIEFDDEETP